MDDLGRLPMNGIVEELKGIIALWEEGRYSINDFVDKIEWVWVRSEQLLEALQYEQLREKAERELLTI